MNKNTIESSKNLEIGDLINGRKIIAKMTSVPEVASMGRILKVGTFHYQVPAKKTFPRRKAGSPEGIRVDATSMKATGRLMNGRFLAKEFKSQSPMVTFRFIGRCHA